MNVQYILIDDNNAEHRDLSIYRTGRINRVRLQDKAYTIYSTIELDAHDYAAIFHYGIVEAMNELHFISESGNGLDSWDEAFLHHSALSALLRIIRRCSEGIDPQKKETILLGWQNQPVGVAWLRLIDPVKTAAFLRKFDTFIVESEGYDLEFIL
ncbi:hypothetical protein [Pelodictyon phaeoclathratiforme]|jgi:hypothetical protein|uniref:Uncharacterized protein n=1 Tax=Pelodictyon phaeoclathratiforme (strain DSM 5477 / BU-1) TaxID=324925 RepID=B4SFV2_PELPB|nr:hypothetical protein [Pelodictyon phaeoclathratiforme]ACF44779.1 conserved hypothetical protein [Pelodictyon phaeoclathratiforme BU-1]MBV5289802.1 hypothetical protein [Pelodictyon phaeoclathratiforme]